nr:Stf0 family sulfotransferase [Sulfitobacter brevis]
MICATPRSGSTLLCTLLRSTGIAGDPNSYFRPNDVAEWALEWGLPSADHCFGPCRSRLERMVRRSIDHAAAPHVLCVSRRPSGRGGPSLNAPES